MVAKCKSTTHLQNGFFVLWPVPSAFDCKVCKKVEKRLVRKKSSAEKWPINLVFDFLPITSFGWMVLDFFNAFKLSIKFCVLWYSYRIFAQKNFFAYISTKRLKKTEERMFKCVLEFHFTSISVLGGSILSKMAKPLYPTLVLMHWFREFTKARNLHWGAHSLMKLQKRARSVDSLGLSLE